jgi:hypothetical protein
VKSPSAQLTHAFSLKYLPVAQATQVRTSGLGSVSTWPTAQPSQDASEVALDFPAAQLTQEVHPAREYVSAPQDEQLETPAELEK